MSLIDTFRTSFGENDKFWFFRAVDYIIGFIRLKLAELKARRVKQTSIEKKVRLIPRLKLNH